MPTPKWILVSNRLPVSLDKRTGNIQRSSGGLVTALLGIDSGTQRVWVGAGQGNISRNELNRALRKAGDEITYDPVHIADDLYADYYNGMCNDVLWPLLHYESQRVYFNPKRWNAYKKVSALFAEAVLRNARSGDLVWIHDFHLFLVPELVRQVRPDLRIGFFLHTPFPSAEIYRQLPVRKEILHGVLASDLVGFHDYSYLRHFATSVNELLGGEPELFALKFKSRRVELGVFPVSINTQQLHQSAVRAPIRKLAGKLRQSWNDDQVILGIDRLDYIKGIPLRLQAFRRLLESEPRARGRVRLVQIAVPSRIDVPEYADLKAETERLVGEINGAFGTVDYLPIHYHFTSVTHDHLLALYRESDVLYVSSTRDGMNLVAVEYLCCQDEENPGVVVLSEFTGAHSNLSNTLSVNPWDIDAAAATLWQAITLPRGERVSLHKPMLEYLLSYSATEWARSFTDSLVAAQNKKNKTREPELIRARLPRAFTATLKDLKKGDRPILLASGFTGVLANDPKDDEQERRPAVLKQLRLLVSNLNAKCVVVSGRDSRALDRSLRTIRCDRAAEYGAFFRAYPDKWKALPSVPYGSWFPQVTRLMEDAARRTPGTSVHKRRSALIWSYKGAPSEFGEYQARRLYYDLRSGLANLPVFVEQRRKAIEVRPNECQKGHFLRWYLRNDPTLKRAFVIAVGDDETDEDLFKSTNERGGISIKVGAGETCAQYRLESRDDVSRFLEMLRR